MVRAPRGVRGVRVALPARREDQISFPAETARTTSAKFSIYAFPGCVPWVFALTYPRFLLGEKRERKGDFLHYPDHAAALAAP